MRVVRVRQVATGCPPFPCHLLDDLQTSNDPWMASVEHSLAKRFDNAQGTEGRHVVAVPVSMGSHNEGMNLDQVVVALSLQSCLECLAYFFSFSERALEKALGARLVGDCHVK